MPWTERQVREAETVPPPAERPAALDGPTRFPCRRCGAQLKFAAGRDALACEFCGHENPIERAPARIEELDYHAYLGEIADQRHIEVTQTVRCEPCGAEYTLDENVHADACPFCGGDVVTDTGENRHIKPGALLPFAIDERSAREALGRWLAGLWFAPNDLKKYARQNGGLTGMYAPYWTYDSDTVSDYEGQRGDAYTVMKTVTVVADGKTQRVQKPVTKIRWTHVRGRVGRAFDDVLVMASESLPRTYVEALEPWDLGALEPYQPSYLSGFRAEAYQIDLDEGFDRARTIMNDVIRMDIRSHIGGDMQRIHHVETRHNDITFKHILLPLWLAAYRYEERSYRFVVNARTGAVKGERPWSKAKIAAAVVAGLVVAIAAAFAFDAAGGFDAISSGAIRIR